MKTLPLALYAAATGLLEPLAPALLRRRADQGKEDAQRLPERLGRAGARRPDGPLVWLHGVSVGESLSLLPLIEAIRARRPDLTLLVTSGTLTSAEVLAKRLPAGVIHQFAPIDTPGATRRFLDHWKPGAALFVESEFWPNLILAARAHGVRLGLVSARITEASAKGWGRAPASARRLMQSFELLLPQDEPTAARIARLGGQPGPQLNLKLAGPPPPVDGAAVGALRAALAGRRVVLAASTHPGEEALIGRAFREAAPADTLLIVAPRHPDRGAGVAGELAGLGFTVARRAAGEPLAVDTTAYVADTLGELGVFYAVAEVVILGGSFVAGVGGHNPMEAARLGRAILTGPHVANAADIYASLFAEKAAVRAADPTALASHIADLLAHPALALRMGEAAQAFADRQGEALEAAMALIAPLLPA